MPDDVVLKVSANRDPGYSKKVAGAVGWRLREAGFCKIRAIKADAVNTAIKAIAVVNQRTRPKGVTFAMDLTFAAADSPGQDAVTTIAMTVSETTAAAPTEMLEYKVSGKDAEADEAAIGKLAGALASPARQGKGIKLRCIGPSSVYKAILACIMAKGFLYPNGLEVIAIPSWDTVIQGDHPISLIQIEFWAKKIENVS